MLQYGLQIYCIVLSPHPRQYPSSVLSCLDFMKSSCVTRMTASSTNLGAKVTITERGWLPHLPTNGTKQPTVQGGDSLYGWQKGEEEDVEFKLSLVKQFKKLLERKTWEGLEIHKANVDLLMNSKLDHYQPAVGRMVINNQVKDATLFNGWVIKVF